MSATERKEARRLYRATHWGAGGTDPAVRLRTADPRGIATKLGDLVSLVYRTKKAGYFEVCDFDHTFDDPPVLAFDRDGLLLIAGGSYVLTPRGIEG